MACFRRFVSPGLMMISSNSSSNCNLIAAKSSRILAKPKLGINMLATQQHGACLSSRYYYKYYPSVIEFGVLRKPLPSALPRKHQPSRAFITKIHAIENLRKHSLYNQGVR